MNVVRMSALALGLMAAASVPALAQEGGRVSQIVVQGIQRVEPETVKSYMALAEGDPYDSDRIDRSLKALYNTGLFADVSIRREGSAVVVRVVENPIINRIAFEGNKRLKEDQLTQETQLRPRTVYTRTKVQTDVKRILDLYRRNGRFAATVEPKIIQLEQNRVDLVFEINEGEATYVKRISFVGNHKYTDSRLRDILATKEERWYRFFSSDDTYDPDRLTYDRELLRRYYLKHGFADFRVASAVAELTPDREGFFMTFTLDEGDRYKFGKADLKVSIKDVDPADLQPLLISQEGDWYNADQVEDIVQKLTDALGSRGYAFVDVRPQVQRDRDNKVINVTYEIQEGPRVYVERIDINGNVRTLDKVIRREFSVVEGDAFNTAKLRRSRQRLKDLGFFEKVEVNNVPSETAPDRTVIKVDVQEKSTGELSFGVGWSTTSGPILESTMRERNLLGRGQDLKISGAVGTTTDSVDVAFTEPYLFDRPLSGGLDAFGIKRELEDDSSYDVSTMGVSGRLGYYLTENLKQDLKYTIKRDKVENVDDDASTYIKEQEGVATTSSVQQSLLWDYRDSKIDPGEGYYFRLANEVAGLGGSEKFIRNSFGAGQYYTIDENVIASLTGSFGVITGLANHRVRINDRYFLGGDTMRGFATGGISPRDSSSDDALGGLWQYYGSAQVRFPLGLPEEMGFAGQVFTDFGSVGHTAHYDDSTNIEQSSSIRVSAGFGVTWKSPMGPVAVDIGIPLKKESFDDTELFRFNFGSRF